MPLLLIWSTLSSERRRRPARESCQIVIAQSRNRTRKRERACKRAESGECMNGSRAIRHHLPSRSSTTQSTSKRVPCIAEPLAWQQCQWFSTAIASPPLPPRQSHIHGRVVVGCARSLEVVTVVTTSSSRTTLHPPTPPPRSILLSYHHNHHRHRHQPPHTYTCPHSTVSPRSVTFSVYRH
jgi:hypothetical protein